MTQTSYSDMETLLGLFETRPKADRLEHMQSLLVTATNELIREMGGRDFFRHPETGVDEVWYAAGSGYDVLHAHEGIVELAELAILAGKTYQVVDADDYFLRGANWRSDAPIPDGEPAYHLAFTGRGKRSVFPLGVRSVRLTGARGWPQVPAALALGTAQRARQMAFMDGSYSGSIAGPPEYAAGAPYERWPQTVWHVLNQEKAKLAGCST